MRAGSSVIDGKYFFGAAKEDQCEAMEAVQAKLRKMKEAGRVGAVFLVRSIEVQTCTCTSCSAQTNIQNPRGDTAKSVSHGNI
eukprot:2321999-Rhodomonas_salina.2